MTTAARQKQRIKKEKVAKAQAAAKVEEAVEEVKSKRTRSKELTCTAEDIIRERDERGLSWRQVATNLDLGSPGAARAAYTKLTGIPHNESQPKVNRAPRGSSTATRKVQAPGWNDETDQDEIIERLQGPWIESTKKDEPGHYRGSVILVRRNTYGHAYEEEVRIERVIKFAFDGKDEDGPLLVHVWTGQAHRCFRVAEIAQVR